MATEWARREGEPTKWFKRFERYRLTGSNRTILGAYQQEAENNSKAKSPPSSWSLNAEKWQWKARAEAWDMHEAERIAAAAARRAQEEEEAKDRERREWREKRRQLAQAAFNKVALALSKIGTDDEIATLSQAVNSVKVVLGELRAEFDELPTQRGMVWNLDPERLAAMSDEEIEELEEAIANGERFSPARR